MSTVFDLGVDHSRRELLGYGATPPDPRWPGGAKICVSFVVNYEEGAEHIGTSSSSTVSRENYNENDGHAEVFLTENGVGPTVGTPKAHRNLNVEQQYEFGAHRGFWRILALFKRHNLRFTSWAVGRAVQLNPSVAKAMEEAKCEVASHGWRWIDYASMSEQEETQHVKLAIEALAKASSDGKTTPRGWYTGRQSLQTRRIVYETYRDLGMAEQYYDSDAYDEDLPYYVKSPSPSKEKASPPLLVIPYTLDNNDMKFGIAPGFSTSDHFFTYLKDAFDVLLEEGQAGEAKMMSIGLHCRMVGRPGRLAGLTRFVEYVKEHEQRGLAWVATRDEIADHWRKTYPPQQ
ncbi:glycoside hydrolase/deacetylase [Acaromyces ingoldii]|uniref:Glycoside hydrolase/deacetylase n=1 Tax=Acaromyces ingoldii TaxID=215250 RepID=A0A316YTI7_9BASI|nr:glycoside hydrolase/deacetylase [Acaromyces ingoldii]PWN91343.1 glycoside hydrolase/deacetylase [Acaromyces ingoldii]